MRGIADPPPTEAEAVPPAEVEAFEALEAAFAELNVRPGASAETSAAKPAVRAAAPRITQRRVRPTRARAASRIKTARDRSLPGPPLRYLCPIFELTMGRDCQRSVRAI
jgi:hypothetical protein